MSGSGSALWVFVLNAVVLLVVVGFAVAVTLTLARRQARRQVEEERLAAMGTAAARIVHQIKNPVQTLLLHAELLARGRGGPVGAEGGTAEAILREAGRISELLSELALYASGGGRTPTVHPLPVGALLKEVVRSQEPLARADGVRLELGEVPEVDVAADAYYLRQALENLVRNAREAAAGVDGGAVRVSAGVRGGEVVVEVADNGPGVPRERARRIFEPFVTSKSRGMGLGLAVTREIVEAHGGWVELESRPGAGARFLVHLPLGAAAPE